jgi:GNAT superfamily N-acetyltransferase
VDIVLLDPARIEAPLLDALHACRAAIRSHDQPDDPPCLFAETAGFLQPDALGERRTWAAVEGDQVLGRARLALADRSSNPHASDIDLEVRPDVRRGGVGRALLDVCIDYARNDGRTMMSGEEMHDTGAAFATAVGAELAMENSYSRLTLADANVDFPVAEGYRLVRSTDRLPEEYLVSYAAVKEDMADAPIGSLDINPWRWDAKRVRHLEDAIRNQGRMFHTVIAVHESSNEVAALTEVVLWPDSDQRGDQNDTIVARAHRGHGLGLAVKADMIRWMRTEHPTLREIETWNAADNTYMLAVNTKLGFTVAGTEREWQLRL